MIRAGKALATTALLVLAVLAIVGCGDGGSSSATTTSASGADKEARSSGGDNASPEPSGQTSPKSKSSTAGGGRQSGRDGSSSGGGVPGDTSANFHPPAHHDSGGGSGQFVEKGGDNSIQQFGFEPSDSELAPAAAALHGYLDARAAHAWAASCEYLAAGVAEQLTQLSAGAGGKAKQPSCAEVVAGLSGAVPDQALHEAAVADVASLRAEGERGFLLFKGAQDADYFIPMVREDGSWKVAAIAASPLG
jgi:hypothetical protein